MMRSDYYPDFVRYDPYRPLDWRWQRAQELLAEGCNVSRFRDDEATCELLYYLRQAEHQSQGQRARWSPSCEVIREAINLRTGPEDRIREIEARILCRQAVDDIGPAVDVPAQVIGTYESLFFCVLDKINATDWIQAQAIGSPSPPDKWTLLKKCAMSGGLLLMEALLPEIRTYPAWVGIEPDVSTPEARLALQARRFIEMELHPWDARTALELAKLSPVLTRRRRKPRKPESLSVVIRDLCSLLTCESESNPSKSPKSQAGAG